jgi:hypothetical protein
MLCIRGMTRKVEGKKAAREGGFLLNLKLSPFDEWFGAFTKTSIKFYLFVSFE